jgi:hypothetical protein
MTPSCRSSLTVPTSGAASRGSTPRWSRSSQQHDYPPEVEALVAEMALLTAMIGQTIKLRWKLSLQVRGDGPIRLIATDFYAPPKMARRRASAPSPATTKDWAQGADPFPQTGKGYFAILIDQGKGTAPYQGITPLSGGSLTACAETYFAQSEQLPTRFTDGLRPEPGARRTDELARRRRDAAAHAESGAARFGRGRIGRGRAVAAEDLIDGDEGENWRRANMLLDTVDELELVGPACRPRTCWCGCSTRNAARLRCAAGGVRLHLFGRSRAAKPVDLFGQGHRPHDDRRGHRHRRLPVLRRALRVRPPDAGVRGRLTPREEAMGRTD